MGKEDYDVLLSLMETGRTAVLKHRVQKDERIMATVLATANYLERIPLSSSTGPCYCTSRAMTLRAS
jgi:hypothetical protein